MGADHYQSLRFPPRDHTRRDSGGDEHPIVTYRVEARGKRPAELFRYIGDPNVVIEVVAEHVDDSTRTAFHAMTLRSVVAREVLALTGGALNLLGEVTPQRR